MPFQLIDTTLRDGSQRPGMRWTREQRVWFATQLDRIAGIAEIEAGIPAASGEDADMVAELADMGLRCPIIAWNRMREADVRLSMKTGAQRIHITVPASGLHLSKKLGISLSDAAAELQRLVFLAVDAGFPVSVGLEDASRAERSNLETLAQAGLQAGADRFRLADTVGVWHPRQVSACIDALHARFGDIGIAVHTHNDLGMACSNALAARDAGAGWADVTVCGVGERAGNCDLGVMVQVLQGEKGAGVERLERQLGLLNP